MNDTHATAQDDRRRCRRHKFSRHINRKLKRLHRFDNRHGPLALFKDYSLIAIAISGALLAFEYLPTVLAAMVYAISAVLIGAAQRGLATILHEGSHMAVAENRSLNWILAGPLAGWPILQLFATYFGSHVQRHHPLLGDPVRDPDIENYIAQGLLRQSPDGFVTRNLVTMCLGVKTLIQLPYLLKHRLVPADWNSAGRCTKLEIAGFVAAWIVVLGALAMQGWLLGFVLFWVVPFLTTFQAIGWLIETSEHFPIVFLSQRDLDQTRNRLGNRFERFLFGRHGEWAHLIHHLRPGIPFWLMREAHEILLEDDEYRRATERYAGLFTRTYGDAPTIISAMAEELRSLQAANAVGEHHTETGKDLCHE